MRVYPLLIIASLMTQSPFLSAEELTITRLVASPSLTGPVAKGVKVSTDGKRVTFLQGRADNQDQQDLWEYNMADGNKRLLVDSVALLGGEEELDEVELARRERARIVSSGIVEYAWSPDGKALLFPLGGDIYYLEPGSEPRRLTKTGPLSRIQLRSVGQTKNWICSRPTPTLDNDSMARDRHSSDSTKILTVSLAARWRTISAYTQRIDSNCPGQSSTVCGQTSQVAS